MPIISQARRPVELTHLCVQVSRPVVATWFADTIVSFFSPSVESSRLRHSADQTLAGPHDFFGKSLG